MKHSKYPQSQITASARSIPSPVDLNLSKLPTTPSPEEVARRAYSIYQKQGSQPGHELKHWLEAEAQLFGGIQYETQTHPGSPLFATEP